MHSTRRTPPLKHFMALAALAGLAACGGGGSDDRASYTLGGSASGVPSGQTLVLTHSGGEEVAVAANGSFTFARSLADGSAYSVAVKTAPAGTGCVVRNASGTVAAAAVDTVAVRCAPLGVLSDGSWEQDKCQSATGSGVRDLWRMASGTNGPLAFGAGTVTYRNEQCSGVGVEASGALSRTFWFQQDRADVTAGVGVFWGTRQTFPRGLLEAPVYTKVVLARRANHLCLLEDTATPSAFPNAASVEPAVIAAIAAGQCYTPR